MQLTEDGVQASNVADTGSGVWYAFLMDPGDRRGQRVLLVVRENEWIAVGIE